MSIAPYRVRIPSRLVALSALAPIASVALLAPGAAAQCEAAALQPASLPFLAEFGSAVAIGGPRAIVGAAGASAAYVYRREGVTWIQEGSFSPAGLGYPAPGLGRSVAISDPYAGVVAYHVNAQDCVDSGYAFVYRRDGPSWSLAQTLSLPVFPGENSYALDVALQGDTLAIAGRRVPVEGCVDLKGDVWVYRRQGASWTYEASLLAVPGLSSPISPGPVALDGERVLARTGFGAPSVPRGLVFRHSGTSWALEAELVPSDPTHSVLTVALDGERALVGSHVAAHVFRRSGSTWTEEATLLPSDGAAGFGSAVALSGDRALIVAGIAAQPYHVYLFERGPGGWTELGQLAPAPGPPGSFPASWYDVALSGDWALIGTPTDASPTALPVGAAHFFALGATDCDADGLADACEIVQGGELDLDHEGTPDDCQALGASPASISLAAGGAQQLALHAGAGFQGDLYLLLGSASGSVPGTSLFGYVLPLNTPDAYFSYTLASPGFAPLSGSLGVLGAGGSAAASFAIAAGTDPALAGAVVHHAAGLLDLGTLQVSGVTNAMPVSLAP